MTYEQLLADMRAKLQNVVPDFEIEYKAKIAHEINQLKKERNAVILGHNYMEPALFHSVPDYTGDSLALSRLAAETPADIIVFCGVEFMAETAKILNPSKTVLIPSQKAGCSLASSITAEDVRNLKAQFPGVPNLRWVAIRLLDGDERIEEAVLDGSIAMITRQQEQTDAKETMTA